MHSAVTKIITDNNITVNRGLFLLRVQKTKRKRNQDAAAHLQRRSDRPLSPPYTAPTATLQLAVESTKNIT